MSAKNTLIALALVVALPAWAAEPAAPPTLAPSPNATVNLINLLVKQGILTAEQAQALVAQANEEAAAARAADAGAAAGAAATVVSPTPAPAPEGSMRVTYVPEVVRKQLREEIKQEVMAQARAENWAAPNTFPDWISRIKVSDDVRARYDGSYFPEGNDATGAFPNFNAINTGSPYDVSDANPNFAPQLNVDQDRNRYRIRARLGIEAALGDGFTAGLRLATGDSSSPVSANQSLGQDGGDFSKYGIWIDRAFVQYQSGGDRGLGWGTSLGRFDNPFLATPLIWDDDLGFDGATVGVRYKFASDIEPFVALGAFPVFNSAFDFPRNQPGKIDSNDKWLYAAQGGFNWKINDQVGFKLGAAYYVFNHVEGELSTPCLVLSDDDACDTDETRPSFAQKGNSYRALRNIIPTLANNFGETDQLQYFGLATPFRELAVTTQMSFDGFGPLRVTLTGELVKNLAFDEDALQLNAINNRGPTSDGGLGEFEGGDSGYLFGVTVGTPVLKERWDWNAGVTYRYLESDAVVDAFTESDFGLGGTNLEGYIFGGNVALASKVWLGMRWMSADSIDGTPYSVDVLQFDINTRF